MSKEMGKRCISIGIVPTEPKIFWDYDLDKEESKFEAIATLTDCIMNIKKRLSYYIPYAIYRTKFGYHLIMELESWDDVQEELYILKKETGKQSIMSCRKQRIRIGEKIIETTGEKISPSPILLKSNVKKELRTGKKEIYGTYDRTDLENISEEFYKILGEK